MHACRRCVALAAALATAWGLVACVPPAGSAAAAGRPQQVEQLVARCVDAMTREVCVARRDDDARSKTPAASQVFVAGAGAIDAEAYNEIRAAGEAMCGLVRQRCTGGWNDGACKTARSLWPAPGRT